MRNQISTIILWMLLILLVATVAVFVYGIVSPDSLPEWIGTKVYTDPTGEVVSAPKTLWDLMSLLIIPIVLAVVAYLFNRFERNAEAIRTQKETQLERERTDNQNQETILREYINKLSELIIDKNLLASDEHSSIRIVARTYTRTVVHLINGKRRGTILRFLKEADLINRDNPIILMTGADLREADLESSNLSNLNLSRVNLGGSILDKTNLTKTNLGGANLTKAFIRNASLKETQLSRANLTEAILKESNLTGTDLIRAKLIEADLSGAVLVEVKMNGADLSRANLCGTNLMKTDLNGAKLSQAYANSTTKWPDAFDFLEAGVELRGV